MDVRTDRRVAVVQDRPVQATQGRIIPAFTTRAEARQASAFHQRPRREVHVLRSQYLRSLPKARVQFVPPNMKSRAKVVRIGNQQLCDVDVRDGRRQRPDGSKDVVLAPPSIGGCAYPVEYMPYHVDISRVERRCDRLGFGP